MNVYLNIYQETVLGFFLFALFLWALQFIKSRASKEISEKWFFNYRLEIGNPLLTIIAPLLIMRIVFSYWNPPLGGRLSLFWFTLIAIKVSIFYPFIEEVMVRAWLFGGFLTVSERYISWRKISVQIIGFLFQAFLFNGLHFEHAAVTKVLNALMYGSLFLIFKRNLLPSIVAHGAWNFYIISEFI